MVVIITLYIFLIFFNWGIFLIGALLILIFFDIYLIWATILNFINIRKRLGKNIKKLKNYEIIEIITNRQYIRKNYNLNFDKEFIKYSEGVLKQIKDIVFLDFDLVQEVRISHLQKKIFFKVAINEGDTNFYIDFKNHEDDEIIQILKEILKEEITFVEARFVY